MKIRTITAALLATTAAALLLAGCGSTVAGTAIPASSAQVQAPVTVTAAPSTVTQPPVTVTQPPTSAYTPPPAPTLDSVVPRHATHGTAADTTVDTLYTDEKYVVDLYLGAGDYVSTTEAGQISSAAGVVTTDLDQLLVHLNNDVFSSAQLTAITDFCNAGTSLGNDIGGLASDTTVQGDWAVFDLGYQNYVAATN